MSFKCGIVGLPNVGKSTLFNAITNTSIAQSANYPFCTIEPNKASVLVPDERLQKLASIAKSEKIIPCSIEIVDIAGLVKGASNGEGLGNQFLENIRQVDAIIHVIRCFQDENIIHVETSIDPIRDIETIETELLLSDLSKLEKLLSNSKKKTGKDDAQKEFDLAQKLLDYASQGKMISELEMTAEEKSFASRLNLITLKPTIYVANIFENAANNELLNKVIEFASKKNISVIPINIKTEADLIGLDENEKVLFLQDIGMNKTALSKVIEEGYRLLNLLTFFTVGPKETRAWSTKADSLAPQAAGVIHTDFERGFIKAETIAYDDFISFDGVSGAKDNGKLRIEGKEYKVQEGDILHFKFNV